LDRAAAVAAVCRAVRNSSHVATVMDPLNPSHGLLAVSEPFSEMTGYDERELLGKSTRLLRVDCEHETDPDVWAALRQSSASGCAQIASVVNRNKSGVLFWNTMYIRGLVVGTDRATGEPVWLTLAIHHGDEEPLGDSGALRRQGEDLRADVGKELDGMSFCGSDDNDWVDSQVGDLGGRAHNSLSSGLRWS
jgi:PAS domain-containing protein